jgi:PKHD-type hydroxylase
MITGYKWWFWQNEISKKVCNEIIKLGTAKKSKKGFLGDKDEYNPIVRNSNIVWLNQKWIFDIMSNYINLANTNSGWNVQTNWMENVQFTNYNKNGHYDWHVDCYDKPYGDESHENIRGKIRKLSCIINLSDGDKFEGGDLFIAEDISDKPEKKVTRIAELRKQGSIIVFPSYTLHKVSPVLKGKRNSLVCWSLGEPWR